MFNREQREHMEYLNNLPLERRCYCGWYDLGHCYNDCPPDKTRVDGWFDSAKRMHEVHNWHNRTSEIFEECMDEGCVAVRDYKNEKGVQ